MKRRTFTAYGTTTSSGQLLIKNKSDLNQFMEQWPDSEFTLEFTFNEPGTSEALIAYYKRVIVPEFQNAFKVQQGEVMTLDQVDLKLRKLSTTMHTQMAVEGQSGFIDVLIPIETAGTHRATEYIKELKMIGATEFDLIIKPPKSIN